MGLRVFAAFHTVGLGGVAVATPDAFTIPHIFLGTGRLCLAFGGLPGVGLGRFLGLFWLSVVGGLWVILHLGIVFRVKWNLEGNLAALATPSYCFPNRG